MVMIFKPKRHYKMPVTFKSQTTFYAYVCTHVCIMYVEMCVCIYT